MLYSGYNTNTSAFAYWCFSAKQWIETGDTNVRGLWRIVSLASFSTNTSEWETLIDFDALA